MLWQDQATWEMPSALSPALNLPSRCLRKPTQAAPERYLTVRTSREVPLTPSHGQHLERSRDAMKLTEAPSFLMALWSVHPLPSLAQLSPHRPPQRPQ